jgi:SAM-dependent methyltransferase
LFNNFINVNDFLELYRRLSANPKLISQLTNKIFSEKKKKVKSTWAHIDSPPIHWWNIPEVVERWNLLITGNPQKEYYDYFAGKYLTKDNFYMALSLGCGTGYRELRWAETRKFKSITAYDLSELRIEHAKKVSEEKGFGSIINYQADDIYKIPIKENHYDVILGEQSLHHFAPLEELFLRIKKILKPDGYFVINEYVGPNRFQWKREQVKAADDLLNQLPIKYKYYWRQKSIKKKNYTPSRLRMLMNDPSEAVESENIIPLLNKHFQLVELRNYGGTILQLLFDNIAHNFINNEIETKRILKSCFDYEDNLLINGNLQNDFVFSVYKT